MATATAALARAMCGGSGAGAGLAARELLSKAPAPRASSLPAMVASRGFCSNGGGRCAKMEDLVEMNGRIDMVEFELKQQVQHMKFALEKQRVMARAEMMEAEANKMQFRFRLMGVLVWGGSLAYLASHQ